MKKRYTVPGNGTKWCQPFHTDDEYKARSAARDRAKKHDCQWFVYRDGVKVYTAYARLPF